MLCSIKHSNIGKELETLTDFHANGSYEDIAKHFRLLDTKNYAYMVRTTDLEHENYEYDVKYVTRDCYDYLNKSRVYGGEVLINKIGSPGQTYLMPCLNKPVSLGMNLFMLRMKENSVINNITLYLYLNSKIGKSLITRDINGTVPLTIDKESVRNVLVPVFTKNFQNLLSHVLKMREGFFENANNLFKQAQDILNKELGITNIENTKNYSVKSFSESFGESNRLDAEYYQDKYDSIKELLDTKENVESLCHIYDNNYIPTNKQKYQYIELSNIGVNGEISGVEFFNGKELPTRARRLVKKNQVIISSVEGSLQSCALITEEYDGALCSNGFFIIDSDCISSETLLILFKSVPIQSLLKQRCSGTILTAISNDELKKIPLPFIKLIVQKEITQKVQESFKLRKDSKNLINVAIRAVEIAIEKNEEYASQWLIENSN